MEAEIADDRVRLDYERTDFDCAVPFVQLSEVCLRAELCSLGFTGILLQTARFAPRVDVIRINYQFCYVLLFLIADRPK